MRELGRGAWAPLQPIAAHWQGARVGVRAAIASIAAASDGVTNARERDYGSRKDAITQASEMRSNLGTLRLRRLLPRFNE